MCAGQRIPGGTAASLDAVEAEAEVAIFLMIGKPELGLDDETAPGVDP